MKKILKMLIMIVVLAGTQTFAQDYDPRVDFQQLFDETIKSSADTLGDLKPGQLRNTIAETLKTVTAELLDSREFAAEVVRYAAYVEGTGYTQVGRDSVEEAVDKAIKSGNFKPLDAFVDATVNQKAVASGFNQLMSDCIDNLGHHYKDTKNVSEMFYTMSQDYYPKSRGQLTNYRYVKTYIDDVLAITADDFWMLIRRVF